MIETLPTIIAKTYVMSKKDPRMTKDYQYFAVEYSLGVLCALGYAVLSTHRKTPSKKYDIDYSKMSMGLWLSLLREICKEIHTLSEQEIRANKLLQVFHQIGASDLLDTVGTFVSKRNHDMHGNPIAQNDLERELAERDALIIPILQVWQQLSDWSFVVFENTIFEAGQIVYVGSRLRGENPSPLEIRVAGLTDETKPRKHVLYFVNLTDTRQCYTLSPLLLWSFNSSPPRMTLFSKLLTRGQPKLEYNSTDGANRVALDTVKETPLQGLSSAFYAFLYRYRPSRLTAPEVEASFCLSQQSGRINDDVFIVSFTIRNQSNDCTLHSIQADLIFGSEVSIEAYETDDIEVSLIQTEQGLVRLHIDDLETGEECSEKLFALKFTEQGHHQLPPVQIRYQYSRMLNEDESLREDFIEIAGAGIEVIDPNSPTPFRPILNTNLSVPKMYNIDIGDHVEIVLEIQNIGFAVADQVDVELVLPDELVIVQGHKVLQTTINPRESKAFTITAVCWKPGVYNVFLRDVSYTGTQGKRFVSSSTREMYLLIQSNQRKELEYRMRQAYEDLYLEAHEEEQLQILFDKTSSVDELLFRQMERNVRRDRIVEIFKSKLSGYDIEPSELNVKEDRTLVYSVHDIPVFGILLDVNGEPMQDTRCLGLRTFERKEAIQKEAAVPQLPLIQEWISYEVIEKDEKYRDRFFFRWFTGMEQSLKKILKGRRLMQLLSEKLGCESLQFSKDTFELTFSPADRMKIDAAFTGQICLRVDVSNYDHQHIVFELPKTELRLSNEQKSAGYQNYKNDLTAATRVSKRVGFRIDWKRESLETVEQKCLKLWNIVVEAWMYPMCTKDKVGGAKKYMAQITSHVQSLIDSGLCFLWDDQKRLWFMTLDADDKASLLQTPMGNRWGYIYHTGKSTIHIGLRCRQGLMVPADIQSSVLFVQREGLLFAQWNVNQNADHLEALLELISYQHVHLTNPFLISSSLFGAWMTYLINKSGHLAYELIQQVTQAAIPVTDVSKRLNISSSRAKKVYRALTSASDSLCCLDNEQLRVNTPYVTLLNQWFQDQQVNLQMMQQTFALIREGLTALFPPNEGWMIHTPEHLGSYQTIQVYKQSWLYGVHQECKLALGIEANRPFFTNLTAVGVVGRFVDDHHQALRIPLFQAVQESPDFSEQALKQSQWWPIYTSTPDDIRDTGGVDWRFTTLELQQAFATKVCEQLERWKVFEPHIDELVQNHHRVLKQDWQEQMASMIQQEVYQSIPVTETRLSLPENTLIQELMIFTPRLRADLFEYIEGKSCQSVFSSVQETKHDMWERKGVVIESKEPLIEIFAGCLIARQSTQCVLLDPIGGIDLGITMTVRTTSKHSMQSGEALVATDEWNQLIERLLTSDHEGVIVEPSIHTKSIVHHIQHQVPLINLWTDSSTTEERYTTALQWILNSLNLLLEGAELHRLMETTNQQ